MGPVVVISSNSMGVCHVFLFLFLLELSKYPVMCVSLDFSRFIRKNTQADVAE